MNEIQLLESLQPYSPENDSATVGWKGIEFFLRIARVRTVDLTETDLTSSRTFRKV